MKRILCPTLPLAFFLLSYLPAAEEWESVLQANINSEYSETRHNAVKQVDTKCAKGLKALWNVLAITNPDQVDWYVREGAYEALTNAEGEEAMNEILRLLKAPGNDLAKEAVIYSVIWKIRKQFVKQHGGNDDRKIQEATFLLRKKRGLEYFGLVLPFLKELDPDGKKLEWIRTAFEDKSSRVRRAAITGFMAYPDNSSIPLLIDNLKRLEKKKAQNYREWVQDRFALETLTGEYFRENVEDWARWWEINKNRFGIEKRVEDELEKKEGDGLQQRTTVVREAGVEVTLNMKVAGEKKGYPLLVLPWRHYEPDYFRPYFHGVEEFLRVYYVQMPQFDEFKGLARDSKTNYVVYPTEILAKSLASLMKEGKLEKYAILGHGPDSCVAAMMLASIYPKQVTHLVLINPRSAGSEYDTATINVRKEGTRRKNREIIKGADSITGRHGPGAQQPSL